MAPPARAIQKGRVPIASSSAGATTKPSVCQRVAEVVEDDGEGGEEEEEEKNEEEEKEEGEEEEEEAFPVSAGM